MQAVISQHSGQGQVPLVVSLTNVAVSKQQRTLQSTAATRVTHSSSSEAACRVRQHAVQPQAHTGDSDTQRGTDAGVESSSFQVGFPHD